MKEIMLSIIVPVYNVELYLEKCLSSIFASNITDYEVVVINDGTKDNSEQIILKYVEKYKDRITYISKENTGLSDTRNIGISIAKGKYIAFVDSDDYIEPNMYELMLNKAVKRDFDVVAADVRLVYENNNKEELVSSRYEKDLFDKEEIKKSMLVQYPVVWNKIYKKSLLDGIAFSKGVWYEDMEFVLKLYPRIKSIGVVKEPLYNYLQRGNSITYTYNDKLYDIINNMNKVIDYYKANDTYDEYKEELEYLYVRYAFATFPKRLAKCGNKEKYEAGIEYAFKQVNEYFPKHKNNKYFTKMGLKGRYIKSFNRFLANINYYINK